MPEAVTMLLQVGEPGMPLIALQSGWVLLEVGLSCARLTLSTTPRAVTPVQTHSVVIYV